MGKEKVLPVFAFIFLLIGSVSSVYVYAMNTDVETICLNERDYTIDQIFFLATTRTFPSLNYSGIALDDFVRKTGLACPECYDYTIIGDDGYQKTVQWENMKNGLLTSERKTVFSDLPKAYRVKNVIAIEVIEI